MEATMVPLESVLGWIFAVLGFMTTFVCFGCMWVNADLDDDISKRFWWTFALGIAVLIVGVIFVVRYWGGGA